MNSDTPLDYALFQLSPRRTRCELFVSAKGKKEKLASGFLKPFITQLRVQEEQASQLIKLEVEKGHNVSTWFNKGTLERFVGFVTAPEMLELVNTLDEEMTQLEGARRIYLQAGTGDHPSAASSGKNDTGSAAAADVTKKDLLRAIDVRLIAVRQDLTMACAHASAAGFTLHNVSELLLFADHFGAQRLNEACTEFISLCQRHPELISCHKPELISHQHTPSPSSLPTHLTCFKDRNIRSSSGSDMSIDEPEVGTSSSTKPIITGMSGPQLVRKMKNSQPSQPIARHLVERNEGKATEELTPSSTSGETAQHAGRGGSRRLSIQDRINLFESKQKGDSEHRRLPSDISEKSVLRRRWSGASDMSIDLNNTSGTCSERKGSSSPVILSSSSNSHAQFGNKKEAAANQLKDTTTSRSQVGYRDTLTGSRSSSSSFSFSEAQVGAFKSRAEGVSHEGTVSKMQSVSAMEKVDGGPEVQLGASLAKMRQGGLSDQVSPDQSRKLQEGRDCKLSNQENTGLISLGNKDKEGMKVFHSPTSMQHAETVKPSKGNQQLNDELQMKVNELEKHFAADKLRVRRDQTFTSRRRKPIDVEVDGASQAVEKRMSNGIEFDAKLMLKMVDNRDYSKIMIQGLGDFFPSSELRGKFYEKYIKKRDAKLKEEWVSKRSQKEAKMKAMHDSFEHSQAEMKAKFASSATRQDLGSACHRTEKRCFNQNTLLEARIQTKR